MINFKSLQCNGVVFEYHIHTAHPQSTVVVTQLGEEIGTAVFDHNMEQAHVTFPTHTTSINYFNMKDQLDHVAQWIAEVSFCD